MALPESRGKCVRTPRLYRSAATVYRGVVNRIGSLKGLLHQVKHPNLRGIHGLVCKALQHTAVIDDLLEGTTFLVDSRIEEALAKVLIAELLWGKGHISGDSTAIKVISKKQEFLQNRLRSRKSVDVNGSEDSNEPAFVARWARINTMLISVEECLAELENLGWELQETPKSRGEFIDLVKSLGEAQFVVDIDFPTLVAFPNFVNVRDWVGSLIHEKKLLLQDKASCLPVSVLKPRPGSKVIDACAAPGLKTLHIAEMLSGAGHVMAVELDGERFKVLQEYLTDGSDDSGMVEAKNCDFLALNPEDYADVEYILVDPSCSGSGIAKREDKLMGETVCKKRLEKLAGFQAKILAHALRFPNVKRVVYSTCSIMPEENEYVVGDVLAKPDICSKFKLKDFGRARAGKDASAEDQWESVHGEFYQCKRTIPERDLCNGFFVAAFERRKKSNKSE